mmetsp:Transcript_25460/g.64100  ORF Transcript_25460/g.64100 Transcript_25460/m.64100 type:complete len:726 (+) Transcript_25460:56-2233(+)
MAPKLVESEALLTESDDERTSELQPGSHATGSAPSKRRRTAIALLFTVAVIGVAVVSRSASSADPPHGAAAGSSEGVQLAQQVACRQLRGGSADGTDPCEPLPEKDMRREMNYAEKHHEEMGGETCSGYGENCGQTQCCSTPGMQCYKKDSAWAECRRDCIPGPDPSHADAGHWSCETLGARAQGQAPNCSKLGQDCSSSKCCADPGLQCFEKVKGFATCKAECVAGIDVTDVDATPWTCNALGPRTPGVAPWVAEVCSVGGAPINKPSCFATGCCATPGMSCFAQNDFYGECRAQCPGGWSCKTRGYQTPQPAMQSWQVQGKVASWVKDKCAAPGTDCSASKCCSAPGHRCFSKNSSWAECKGSCAAGPDLYDADASEWSCKELGPLTPGGAAEPWKSGKEVAKWVGSTCSALGSESCLESKCCKQVGQQCYRKNEGWAACFTSCTPGPMPGDDSGNWTCETLGPRTHRPWGKPTLYCFVVVQPVGYEPGLVKAQAEQGVGIFGCDEFSVFSTKGFSIGVGPLGPVETSTFVPAAVVKSKDGTAGNAELFMHVWNSVHNLGLYQSTDWTIKADPDAVVLPDRLRNHLRPHTGQSAFMVNCAKPYMPEGPMMFGALEAISRQGLETYFAKAGDCIGGLPWKEWGEDLFLNQCFKKIGVARKNDFKIYSDGVCTGVDCRDPDAAAFHPKKDVNSWMACLNETKHPKPRPSTPAPQWFKDYMDGYAR